MKVSSKSILKILSYLSIFKILLKSILHNTGDAMTVYTSVSNVVRLYAKSLANENATRFSQLESSNKGATGAAERAADELARLLDRCVSNVDELSSTSGDEQLITACLYRLQVRTRRPRFTAL